MSTSRFWSIVNALLLVAAGFAAAHLPRPASAQQPIRVRDDREMDGPLLPDRLLPVARTLTSDERRELYVRLLESFVGWAERVYWNTTDGIESDGGFYDAAGSGVTWARGNSNMCLVLAVLLSSQPTESTFSEDKIPRSRLTQHLEQTLRSLCLSNKNFAGRTAIRWGGPSWQASLEFTGAAWAAHLQEPMLKPSTRNMVREVLAAEADALQKTIPDYSPGDTKAEDGLWNAQLLAFAANKLSSDSRASSWDTWAKRWALNAISMAGDRQDRNTVIDGRPSDEWISTANVFPDFTLENHGFWHPAYNLEFGRMAQAQMSYLEFGRPVPEAFSFRQGQMWERLKVLLLWDGDAAYPQGNDWAYKDIQHQYYATWLATAGARNEASAFESRGVQFLCWRQMARGDGSVCDFDFGYHTDLAYTWSFCWQMHNHWPSNAVPYPEAEAGTYGVHHFPHARAIIHRNRDKIVTLSYPPAGQGIHIMPAEGVAEFPAPPFYFSWQRDSGVMGRSVDASLHRFETTHSGKGMHAVIQRPWNDVIDEFVTVVSLPGEATVCSSILYAKQDVMNCEVGRSFHWRATWLPERPGSVIQRRGTNWLNMSGHIGFVSPDSLPPNIPSDEFFAADTTVHTVKAGHWFDPVVIITLAGQTPESTREYAALTKATIDLEQKVFTLTTASSGETVELDLWP